MRRWIDVVVKVPEDQLGAFYADIGRWLQDHTALAPPQLEPEADRPPSPDGSPRPWTAGPAREQLEDAAELYAGLSDGARRVLDHLVEHAGEWVSDTTLAEILGVDGPQAVAGTLGSVSTRAKHVQRELPYQYVRSPHEDEAKGEYRMSHDTAELFQRAQPAARERQEEQAVTAWIFQGNPKMFDIDRYLREQYRRGEEIVWTCKPKRHVEAGQRVFLWRADGGVRGSGGIVAVGEALAEPEFRRDDATGLWKPGASYAHTAEWRVRIRLLEAPRLTPGEGMILRTELEGDPVVGNLQILHYRALMVCAVWAPQERELMRRWEGRRRPAAA